MWVHEQAWSQAKTSMVAWQQAGKIGKTRRYVDRCVMSVQHERTVSRKERKDWKEGRTGVEQEQGA